MADLTPAEALDRWSLESLDHWHDRIGIGPEWAASDRRAELAAEQARRTQVRIAHLHFAPTGGSSAWSTAYAEEVQAMIAKAVNDAAGNRRAAEDIACLWALARVPWALHACAAGIRRLPDRRRLTTP